MPPRGPYTLFPGPRGGIGALAEATQATSFSQYQISDNMRNTLIALFLLLASFSVNARVNIDGCLKGNPDLRGAYVGVLAVTADGDTLACHNADALFVPASNMKLVTVASALEYLGAEYRYETKIAVSGKIEDGTLHGNVYVVGGGDPTTAYPDSPERLFASWAEILADSGIKRIEGKIVGDGSSFSGMKESPDWLFADIGTYYGTGVTGLQFAGNTLNLDVVPGPYPGSPLEITQVFPLTPWIDLVYDCTTGEKGTGDQLYLYTTDFARTAILRGTFAAGKKPKTVRCSNKYPELTCAKEFYDFLSKSGLYVEGYDQGKAPADASILGTTVSSPLKDIVVPLMRDSDNFLAETIFRTLGKECLDDDRYESSVKAETMILESAGVTGLRDIVIDDGSGLSPNNLVSPAFLCRLLHTMLGKEPSGAFLNSLPVAGVNGTVASFLPDLPDKVRHRIHLKSGSHTGVRNYSGYYFPENGSPVIFSVMINHGTASGQKLSSAAGEIISSIVTGTGFIRTGGQSVSR